MRKLKFLNQTGFVEHIVIAAIVVAAVGAVGYYALSVSHAATSTYSQICDYQSPKKCLDNVSGTQVQTASSAPHSIRQAFNQVQLTGMCNHGRVSSTCPFTVGSGLNNRYINDQIIQFSYGCGQNGSCATSSSASGCLGNGVVLLSCGLTNGSGAGSGTIFIRNVAGGGGTAGFVESRYWSDYNYALHQYDSPAWLCNDGSSLNLAGSNSGGSACQWN